MIRTFILVLVTNYVNSHNSDLYSGRQTAQHQTGQLARRLVGVVEAVLQQQRIQVGAHHQVDRHGGFVQRRLALEVPALTARQQDVLEQLLDTFLVSTRGLPALRRGRRGDLVELPVLEKQAEAGFHNRLEHAPQLLWRLIDLGDCGADLGLDLGQAVGADHLANGLLGFEELVDVGLGETDGLGEIGDSRLLVTVAAEMLRRRSDDLVSHLVVGWPPG